MTATIEAPRMNNRCMPRGAVAIVSIDPVASVAALEDVQATLEASALPRGKYLAIVDTLHGFDWSKPIYDMPLGLSFFCVGRGLPEHPEASLALGPGTPLGNDRRHMIIDPPLPWPDCYVYTLDCFYARISRVHPCAPPRTSTVLTEEQWVTVNSSVTKDQMSADLPLKDAYGEPIDIPDDDFDTENEPCYDVEDPHGIATNDVAVEAERQKFDNRGVPEDQCSDLEHAEDDYDPHETRPRLEAWLDLTSTTEFDQPAALLQTLRRLTIIVHESKRRRAIDVLAKQPRTLRWAENVAAADGAGDLERPDDSFPGQAADDTLAPEDAIEHRRERTPAQTHPTLVSRRDETQTQTRRKYRMRLFLVGSFNPLRTLLRRLRGVSTALLIPADR